MASLFLRQSLSLAKMLIQHLREIKFKNIARISAISQFLIILCHCRGHNTLYKTGLILQFPN
jgi:hypothetical protein